MLAGREPGRRQVSDQVLDRFLRFATGLDSVMECSYSIISHGLLIDESCVYIDNFLKPCTRAYVVGKRCSASVGLRFCDVTGVIKHPTEMMRDASCLAYNNYSHRRESDTIRSGRCIGIAVNFEVFTSC